MAQLTFVLGNSGTGKSTSLRNFKKEEIGYITATGKRLPFKTDIQPYQPKNYGNLLAVIEQSKAPVIVIDDFNYFMTNEEFARAKETGYGKFADMAQNVVNVITAIANKESDQMFYILAHTEEDEEGRVRLKTTGKMVRDKFVPEGYTNQVIEATMNDGDFLFNVKADGRGVKTPMGMFEVQTIPNDLAQFDDVMRDFYGLPTRAKAVEALNKIKATKKA